MKTMPCGPLMEKELETRSRGPPVRQGFGPQDEAMPTTSGIQARQFRSGSRESPFSMRCLKHR